MKFFGMRSVEPEGLVILISQLAECLQFLFQPTGIDGVEILLFLIYRGEMVVQSLKKSAQEPCSKYYRLELNVLTPSYVAQFWVSVSVGGG